MVYRPRPWLIGVVVTLATVATLVVWAAVALVRMTTDDGRRATKETSRAQGEQAGL
jgi:hypothetical protein